MSHADDGNGEELVLVARAVKTRGLKGEIVADLLTDFPERFEAVGELIAVRPNAERFPVKLEHYWLQKNRVVLKFEGFDTVEGSAALIGCDFGVPESERVILTEGSYYDWELEGCAVQRINGDAVGTVAGVLRTGGAALLAVRDLHDREVLVPLAESIVVEIDTEKKRILIDPPEGLLEL